MRYRKERLEAQGGGIRTQEGGEGSWCMEKGLGRRKKDQEGRESQRREEGLKEEGGIRKEEGLGGRRRDQEGGGIRQNQEGAGRLEQRCLAIPDAQERKQQPLVIRKFLERLFPIFYVTNGLLFAIECDCYFPPFFFLLGTGWTEGYLFSPIEPKRISNTVVYV